MKLTVEQIITLSDAISELDHLDMARMHLELVTECHGILMQALGDEVGKVYDMTKEDLDKD